MPFTKPAFAVLFVCTANICRSPMAQGLLAQRTAELGVGRHVHIDSAGVRVGMPGQRPDPRALVQLMNLDIKLKRCRSRAVESRDFSRFDYIIGMNTRHVAWLREHAGENSRARLASIMEFAANPDDIEVPDPYYGNVADFARALALLQRGIDGFVADVLEPELQSQGFLQLGNKG
ncbi:MAG: low molecular weight protein-tyrosine-phosphatase [Halieaceae bacterium]|nr:low molecular weight protein-tyrosine-phosphatase [Halieaceae bacterium]